MNSFGSNKVTEEFLKDRMDGNAVSEHETGVWYSGYNSVFAFARENKLPFVGVWTNGDACYYCKRFEKNLMTERFKEWMKDSGCVFWFGCCLDTSEEDKAYGTGFNWAWDNKSVKSYPFCRFFWTDGIKTVNKSASGTTWNGSKEGDAGAEIVIGKMEELLDEVHSGDPATFAACTPDFTSSLRIRTNPEWSEEEVAEFREQIKANDGYCPCVPEHTPDSKCMCRWFREQTTEGTCHCGLYEKYFRNEA